MTQALYAHINKKKRMKKSPCNLGLLLVFFGGLGFELRALHTTK
jgi:hypothetical protein